MVNQYMYKCKQYVPNLFYLWYEFAGVEASPNVVDLQFTSEISKQSLYYKNVLPRSSSACQKHHTTSIGSDCKHMRHYMITVVILTKNLYIRQKAFPIFNDSMWSCGVSYKRPDKSHDLCK